jgi:Protein of unknown function (DUF3302)
MSAQPVASSTNMDVTFGALDVFAFVVMAVILLVAVVAIVGLGRLPGQLARKWGHPQAAAVNVAGWIGVATGGLIWPLALVWAFMISPKAASSTTEPNHVADAVAPIVPAEQESRS